MPMDSQSGVQRLPSPPSVRARDLSSKQSFLFLFSQSFTPSRFIHSLKSGHLYSCLTITASSATDCIINFLPLSPSLTATPPSVTIDGPSTIPAGQTVVLVCNVSRDVIVTWSRDDGRPLPNTPDGNMLRIEMPQVEDGGVYRCSAEGVVAMFNLVVMESPTTVTSEGPVHEVIISLIPRLGRSLGMRLVIVRSLLANYNVK